jgi:hypothetical protein
MLGQPTISASTDAAIRKALSRGTKTVSPSRRTISR